MEILNKIEMLLKQNKQTKAKLCNYLGLGKATFSHWKSGENTSYLKKLPEIAEFFGVSVDYLLGRTNVRETEIKKPAPLSEKQVAYSFEGGDLAIESQALDLTKAKPLNELHQAAKELSVEQINRLTALAKDMK